MADISSTAAVTMQAMSSGPQTAYKNPGDVEFEVKYPKDYTGVKHMPEGPVVVSKEVAEQFKQLGIGKIVSAEEVATDESETGVPAITAKELIEKINAAETAEAVDALLPEGEERTTVLKAVEARKKQLSQ